MNLPTWILKLILKKYFDKHQLSKSFNYSNVFKHPINTIEVFVFSFCDCKRTKDREWSQWCDIISKLQKGILKLNPEYVVKLWLKTIDEVVRMFRILRHQDHFDFPRDDERYLLMLLAEHPECQDLADIVTDYITERGVARDNLGLMLTEADEEKNIKGFPIGVIINMIYAFTKSKAYCRSKFGEMSWHQLIHLLVHHPESGELMNAVIACIEVGKGFATEDMFTEADESQGIAGLTLVRILELADALFKKNIMVPLGSQRKLFDLHKKHPECEKLEGLIILYAKGKGFDPELHGGMLDKKQVSLNFALKFLDAQTTYSNADKNSKLSVNGQINMLRWAAESEEIDERAREYIRRKGLDADTADYLLDWAGNKAQGNNPEIPLGYLSASLDFERDVFSPEGLNKLLLLSKDDLLFRPLVLEYTTKRGIVEELLFEVLNFPREWKFKILTVQTRHHGLPAKIQQLLELQHYQKASS